MFGQLLPVRFVLLPKLQLLLFAVAVQLFLIVLEVLDEVDNLDDNEQLLKLISANRTKIEDLLLDIFEPEGMTAEELRKVKLKELIPVFMDLFAYVQQSFKSKN